MPNPRLAAIMFTDIVGYTAMMQSNQSQAMATIKQFDEVLKDRIEVHKGQLLQTYGDGSLSVFESASAAVQCAKEIQESIRGKVPLRIGIHLGEITIDGDHIFGDGVNVASRIESLGTAGSLLVSSSIRQQIKNKPEFDLVSLGKFAFKNVAEPMTVYALANVGMVVPASEQVHEKAKRVLPQQEQGISAKNIVRFASIGFVAMVIGAILFWAGGLTSKDEKAGTQLLSQDIRDAKVGVAVFENFTDDEGLDALGYMASEWIGSGLQELEVRTVSSEMVRQNKEAIGILPNNLQSKPSFAEITGAEYLVTGSYFLNGDSIMLNTRLSSAITGENITTFDDLRGHRGEKELLIQEAIDYLMGYWAARKDGNEQKITPPKYEAYKVFKECSAIDADCFLKALALDPSFLSARVSLINASGYQGRDSVCHSNIFIIEQSKDKITIRDQLRFESTKSIQALNYKAAIQAIEDLYLLDKNDPSGIHHYASCLLFLLNKPQSAVEIYPEIFNKLTLYQEQLPPWTYYHYIDALNRTQAYQKASDFYINLSDEIKINLWDRSARYAVIALIYQNRIQEALDIIQERGSAKEELLQAAFIYNYIYPEIDNPFHAMLAEQADQFEDKLILDWEGIRLFDWKTKATVYYVLGDFEKAKASLLNMGKPNTYRRTEPYTSFPENLYWEKLWHSGILGCTYAKLGEYDKAINQINQVEILGKLYPSTLAMFHRGIPEYLVARIYAEMGEKELAVKSLQESAKKGRPFAYMSFTADMFLVNLKGYPPFEELIRPKG